VQQLLESDKLDWQCHTYERGQDDDWCRLAGIVHGVAYKFAGNDGECGPCRCCKKTLDAGALRDRNGRWAAVKRAQELARRRAELSAARLKYSEAEAIAFAALARLAACGSKPGIFGALTSTCGLSLVPGFKTACSPAGFYIEPGKIDEEETPGGLFYGAKLLPIAPLMHLDLSVTQEATPFGVVLAFHSGRPFLQKLKRGLRGCGECSVHEAHLRTAETLMPQILLTLEQLGCVSGEPCTVYVTGQGPGAAVAQLVAWELALENYAIGTSYLFNAPKVGNEAFAEHMEARFTRSRFGPIFNVVTGRGSTWPSAHDFKPWGYEAYYANATSRPLTAMCLADDGACGSADVATAPRLGSCRHALAPDNDLCNAHDQQCYLGLPASAAA